MANVLNVARVRELRKQRGESIVGITRRIGHAGLDASRWCAIEHGQRVAGIELRIVAVIAEALGVGVDSLLLASAKPRRPARHMA